MVLPVHFELGIKYPVALRFDANGEFKGMVRISNRKHVLQPTLLMLDEFRWLLEELRVALFAQELRTPMPVSAKRLQKAFDAMQR